MIFARTNADCINQTHPLHFIVSIMCIYCGFITAFQLTKKKLNIGVASNQDFLLPHLLNYNITADSVKGDRFSSVLFRCLWLSFLKLTSHQYIYLKLNEGMLLKADISYYSSALLYKVNLMISSIVI